ncbi:MAG: hypothetical protein QM638_01320 [Nocardioides sp.]|uniref:hypothetical protein n=1 Tax=Nocardioides sp. TaxID=35761 RepID=UPI0039E3006E
MTAPITQILASLKMVAALVGSVLTAVSATTLPGSTAVWVSLALAICTGITTYVVPNIASDTSSEPVEAAAAVDGTYTITALTTAAAKAMTKAELVEYVSAASSSSAAD